MACVLTDAEVENVVDFHGHSCPGLAIGIRAAELCLNTLGTPDETDLVAVCETDMCGVDAIQVLTGCTFGKGNLIHRDYGKVAFSFYDRLSGRGVRAILDGTVRIDMDAEMASLMRKNETGRASQNDKDRLSVMRLKLKDRFMSLALSEMFHTTELKSDPPRPAKVLFSLKCEMCGESMMESRSRRFAGETLCIPCFSGMEQKV